VRQDELVGYGEAHPSPRYGDSTDLMLSSLEVGSGLLADLPVDDPEEWYPWLEELMPTSPSARSAFDMALWDLKGQREGKSIAGLLQTPEIKVKSSYTVSLAEPAMLRQRLEIALGYPIVKIKMGGEWDGESLDIMNDIPDVVFRLDVNEGWNLEAVDKLLPQLETVALDLIEQPFPRGSYDEVAALRELVDTPIFADEDCLKPDDLPVLAECYDGVNIKLAKCGGITVVRRMIDTARELGLKVMLGCVVETSLASTAMGHLAGFGDYLDLDGHVLLREDPYKGLVNDYGIMRLPATPGLGITPRD
ncbi:MAG: dipeptide epimerase, partial [Candidatus Neomarinimicrobiota bacterium]